MSFVCYQLILARCKQDKMRMMMRDNGPWVSVVCVVYELTIIHMQRFFFVRL